MAQSPVSRIVLAVSVIAIVLFPFSAVFVEYPAFSSLIARNTQAEAVRIATVLSSILIEEEGKLGELKVSESFVRHLHDLQKDSRILKVKIFTTVGRVIYSTDPREIGNINEQDYFQKIIRTGSGRAEEIERNEQTLEKQVLAADVVETYIPIMKGSTMIGVFEIYYDISAEKQELHGLVKKFAGTLLLLAVILLAAVIFSTRKAERILRERRQIEEALIRSEKQYRTLFEHAGDAIFILEASGEDAGKIVAANRAAAVMHGYTVEEIQAMRITDLDTPDAAERAPNIIKRMLDGEWVKVELSHHRKDGVVFPVEVSAGLMNLGDRKYILAIDRDITARRVVEQGREKLINELREALDNIKTLRGLLPICSSCKKIRDDRGYWNQIESYISSHTAAEFSHSLCPDCMQRLYPNVLPKTKEPGRS